MADRSRDPGLLVQIHIPRCAGTSVSHWLRCAANEGLLSGLGSVYPNYVLESDREFRSFGFADPRLSAVTTHNIRRFPKTICGRSTHYFTIVREPRAHVVSLLRYLRQERSAFGLPATFPDDTREIAAWLLERPPDAPFRDSAQTNHIALFPWCDTTRGRCRPDNYTTWSAADRRAYESERLDLAKSILRSFLAVGVVERLRESLAVLRRRSAAIGIDLLPAERIVHVNATDDPPDDLSWLTPYDPVGRRLHASIQDDFALYRFACELFEGATAAAQ